MADFLSHFIEQLVAAVRTALFPRIEGVVHKVEAVAHQVEVVAHKVEAVAHQMEGLRGEIGKVSAKIDRLGTGGGGLDPAQLATLTHLTAQLHVSAETLQAAVAANPQR